MAATVALLGVIAAFAFAHGIADERTPRITGFSGPSSHAPRALRPGESLSTGAASTAVMTYPDGTKVELGPETTIRVADLPVWERAKQLELTTGTLKADVSPQPRGNPMLLQSPDARAEVLGTRLALDRNTGRTRLEVTHGAVRFVSRRDKREALVKTGYFAESGDSGFLHQKVPTPGITGFTLMNAETDLPIREGPIMNGEKFSLSSLPTDKINIRADFEGDPPDSVKIDIKRQQGHPTGLEPRNSREQVKPPYFVAGDHWADGRPDDCAAWTPPSGYYILSAEAIYADAEKQMLSKPITIKFWITR
jgi:hypothetical protein